MKNRNYNFKDVNMLVAAKTIAESFKANIAELSSIRTNWDEQYATELNSRIDDAISTRLGIDAKKDLRNATIVLNMVQTPAKHDLSFFRVQIIRDFKKEPAKRDEILRTLNFSRLHNDVQKGKQEAMIQLLYSFQNNMTDELRKEVTAKGMNPELIDRILSYADKMINANLTQETIKEVSKEISKDVKDKFNEIYDEIIGICKNASFYYHQSPLKKEQFTFSKIISNLHHSRSKVENEE